MSSQLQLHSDTSFSKGGLLMEVQLCFWIIEPISTHGVQMCNDKTKCHDKGGGGGVNVNAIRQELQYS